jgi:hypothetical protein
MTEFICKLAIIGLVMFYDFNPRHHANHVERRYLGTPGSCSIMLGTESIDPKYEGPCGASYHRYNNCLLAKEFNRNECRPFENEVISCEQHRLGDQSQQLEILANWRKNKGKPVRNSYIPFKLFNEDLQALEKNE